MADIPLIGGLFKKGADALLGSILGPIKDLISEAITDKDKKNEALLKLEEIRAGIYTQLLEFTSDIVNASRDVIVAETQAGGLNALWRPLAMMVFLFIIINNIVLVPYLEAAFGWSILITTENVPAELWNLMTIGMGGYVVGRTVEKVAERYNKRD